MKIFKNHEAHFDLCNSYKKNCVTYAHSASQRDVPILQTLGRRGTYAYSIGVQEDTRMCLFGWGVWGGGDLGKVKFQGGGKSPLPPPPPHTRKTLPVSNFPQKCIFRFCTQMAFSGRSIFFTEKVTKNINIFTSIGSHNY